MHQIVFKISEKEAISFDLSNDINAIYPCDEIVIKFSTPNQDYTLSIDCIREDMESLYHILTKAINNEAQLHESITKDVGYLWNEEMQNKPGLTYFKIENMDYWVGLRNLIWSTRANAKPILSTWLYNDLSGSIILEITPSYPWHTKDPEEGEKFVSYEEWMKAYQPLFLCPIAHAIALSWKDQAETILNQLNKNVHEFNIKSKKG